MNLNFYEALSNEHKILFHNTTQISKDTIILNENARCEGVLFLIRGEIDVYKIGPQGRVLSLYKIKPSESCVINLSCILSDSTYTAIAKASVNCEVVIVPKVKFMELFNQEVSIRNFVFQLFSKRLSDVMAKVESIALEDIDTRITKLLLSKNKKVIHITHEEIAKELGTAREVISRHLKDFEKMGKVVLERGKIKIIHLV